jgi:C-terminal processing protease CtpA/Prc
MLTRDLFEVTKDKHLAVGIVPDRSAAVISTATDDREARARRTNFGVQAVEVLAGNVGYLNLTAFHRPEEAREALSAAMRRLRATDALILDMRQNDGGSPDTVALLASYLFDAPNLPLFEIVPRLGPGRQYLTEDPPVPERTGTRPTYVLTAERTFSAGEGLAFILQERRRAIVVGERTAGAANPGRPYPVSARLEVTVPNGQVRTAVSGRNWEGTGVTPDVSVPAVDALRLAHTHALRELLRQASSGLRQQILRNHLEALERSSRR